MKILTLVAIFMIPLLVLGIFGNLNLIYATWKFRDLRNRNNLLVAIVALFDLICEIYEWKKATEIFLNKAIMKRVNCYRSIFLYSYSFNMANIALLFLAIDRFIAIRLPAKYRTVRTKPFIVLATGIGFIYSTALIIPGFITADNEVIESCDQTTAYSSELMTVWNYSSISIAIAVFILNVVNYHLLRNFAKHHELSGCNDGAYSRQNQLTNSMLITMVADCLSLFVSAFVLLILNLLPLSRGTIANISSFLCLIQLFSHGNNYYILFWRCHTYRKKFLQQLHLIRRNATVEITGRITTVANNHKWIY